MTNIANKNNPNNRAHYNNYQEYQMKKKAIKKRTNSKNPNHSSSIEHLKNSFLEGNSIESFQQVIEQAMTMKMALNYHSNLHNPTNALYYYSSGMTNKEGSNNSSNNLYLLKKEERRRRCNERNPNNQSFQKQTTTTTTTSIKSNH